MSVLKSIFHRYNKTTSSYDTLHPETEHAQVTDFGQGVIAHLASNVLASTISSITSDSLMAKLVKLVFNATGVQYNIAQNGYVKFGDLFGGLIIQWGSASCDTNNHVAQILPITFTDWAWSACTDFYTDSGNFTQSVIGARIINLSTLEARGRGINGSGAIITNSIPTFSFIVVGK